MNSPITILATLSLALAMVTAAPTTTWPFTWTPSSDGLKSCDQPTFSTLSGVIPADWRDCASLYSEWAAENGTFVLNEAADDTFATILKSDSCTLAIKPSAEGGGPFTIGDVDVNDILNGTLSNFSDGTILSAQGDVRCPGEGGEKKSLHWQIFDSSI